MDSTAWSIVSSLVVLLLEAVPAALTASETPAIASSSGISAIATRSYSPNAIQQPTSFPPFASTTELTAAVRFCGFSTRVLIAYREYVPSYM